MFNGPKFFSRIMCLLKKKKKKNNVSSHKEEECVPGRRVSWIGTLRHERVLLPYETVGIFR